MSLHLRWWLVRIVTVMVLDVHGKGDDWPDMKVRMAGLTTLRTSPLMDPVGILAMLDDAEMLSGLIALGIKGFSTLKLRMISSPFVTCMPLLTVMISLSPSTSHTPVSFIIGDSKRPASSAILPGVRTSLLLLDRLWSVMAVRATYHGCKKSPVMRISSSSWASLFAALAVRLISEFIPGYPTTMSCSTILSSCRFVTTPYSSILATSISEGTVVNCDHPACPPAAFWSQYVQPRELLQRAGGQKVRFSCTSLYKKKEVSLRVALGFAVRLSVALQTSGPVMLCAVMLTHVALHWGSTRVDELQQSQVKFCVTLCVVTIHGGGTQPPRVSL